MGYGGALIYSGLARDLKARFPEKKVVLVYPLTLDELIWRRAARDRVVWQHNPDIDLVVSRPLWWLHRHRYPQPSTFVVNLDDSRYFYWVADRGDRIEYKSGRHAIQIAADVHGLVSSQLRPRLVLTAAEEAKVDELLRRTGLVPGKFLCIEPHTKDTFSPNKAWFWERWQELVDRLRGTYTVAQVGVPGSPVLAGVVNLTGTTTFRETASVLARSRLLVSAEGGLPHLARAVGTPAVVLLSNVLPPELVAYPGNANLYADTSCVCQGLKVPCPRGRACMAAMTVDAVYQAVVKKLAETVA